MVPFDHVTHGLLRKPMEQRRLNRGPFVEGESGRRKEGWSLEMSAWLTIRRRRVGHRIERSRIGKDTIHLYIPNSVNLGRSIPSRHFLVRNTRGGCATPRHESGIVCCASGSANMSLRRGEGDHENAVSNISNDHAPFFCSSPFFFFFFFFVVVVFFSLSWSPLRQFAAGIKPRGHYRCSRFRIVSCTETNRFQVARKSNFESVVRLHRI